MALTQNDLEMIGLKAGEAAHAAIRDQMGDLKRMMREEASRLDQKAYAACPVKHDVKAIRQTAEANRISIRKMLMLLAGASFGGGAVSRLPDILAAIRAAI